MYRNILEWPNAKLKKSSKPVEDFASIQELKQDLIDTLNIAGGVGLAAPQIGVGKRVFVIDFSSLPCENISPASQDDSFGVFINPTLNLSGPVEKCLEGCLSVPHVSSFTPRNLETHLTWYDESGEKHETILSGLLAQIIQHENDHLDGIVYIQKLSRFVRARLLEKMRKAKKMKSRREKKRKRGSYDF